MPDPSFAPAYVRLMLRLLTPQLTAAPNQREALFAGTGLTEVELTGLEPAADFEGQMRFCANALRLFGSDLGLRLGPQLQLAAHGALGSAMQNAPNLDAALCAFREFGATRASFFRLLLATEGDTATITVSIGSLPDAVRLLMTEGVLFTVQLAIVFFAGRADALDVLELGYQQPTYSDRYPEAFKTECQFDCDATRLRFPAELLALPSPDADPDAYREAIARCRQQMPPDGEPTMTSQVERLLQNNPGQLWRAAEVAQQLGLSQRTLIRRLGAEGQRYQAIRDATLAQQAKQQLRVASVEATAMALGFQDVASFRRSFKRWTGRRPGEFRG